jgi:hypothetical protein
VTEEDPPPRSASAKAASAAPKPVPVAPKPPPPKQDPAVIDRLLRSAIAGKHLVRLTFNNASRVVEPHDYGVRKGVTILLAYQLRQASAQITPEAVEGWRWFDVSKISELSVTKESFPGSRGAAHTRHSEWDTVHARVA